MPPKKFKPLGRSPLLDLEKPWETGAPVSTSNFVFPPSDLPPWFDKYRDSGVPRQPSVAERKANRAERLRQVAEVREMYRQDRLDHDDSSESESDRAVSRESSPIPAIQQASPGDVPMQNTGAASERSSPATPSTPSHEHQDSTSIWSSTHQQESPILGSTTPPRPQASRASPKFEIILPKLSNLSTNTSDGRGRGPGLHSNKPTGGSGRPRVDVSLWDLPDEPQLPRVEPLTAAARASAMNMTSGIVMPTASTVATPAIPAVTVQSAPSQILPVTSTPTGQQVVPLKRKAQDSGVPVTTSIGSKVLLTEIPPDKTVERLLQKGNYRRNLVWFLCQFKNGSKSTAEPISRVALMKNSDCAAMVTQWAKDHPRHK